jgi:hypothetical protein
VYLLLILSGLVFGVSLFEWPARPGTFARANFDRVWAGMSLAEVRGILGPPDAETPVGGQRLVLWTRFRGRAMVPINAETETVIDKVYYDHSVGDWLRIRWFEATGMTPPF